MNIASTNHPRKVSTEVEAEIAAFETAGDGECTPMSAEAWDELARRKSTKILRDTAAGEESHPSDEGWGVMVSALKVAAFIALTIAAVVLYAKWWAVQP